MLHSRTIFYRGRRDIFPSYGHPKASDGAPVWEVVDEGDVKVQAAPMSHGVSGCMSCFQWFLFTFVNVKDLYLSFIPLYIY
jgi:hypothetical protein